MTKYNKKAVMSIIILSLFTIIFSTFAVAWDSSLENQLIYYYNFSSASEQISSYDLQADEGTANYGQYGNCIFGDCLKFTNGNNVKLPNNQITELRTDNTYPSLSWNFWLNGTYDSGEVFMEAYAGGGQGWYAYNNGSNKVKYPYFCDALEVFAPLQIHNNKWVMITFVINNTGVKIYTNGTLTDDCNKIVSGFGINVDTTRELRIGSGNSYGWVDFDGIMDEWAIWNKSLTQSEINLLYNNGAGSSRDEVAVDTTLSLITQLISPANDTLTNDKNVTLNATGTATNGNLTNITFYIWNENNSLYNSYYQDIADNLIISNEIIEATSIPFGNYTWNALFCAFNDSNSLCEFDTENNTLIINYTVPFIPAPSQVEDTTIYQTFASTGAGLGIFLSYLGQSIPLLIISLVFIGIIAVIGLSLAVAVKKAFK